ncbi:MAG: tRNA-splicing ligase RtcB [Polaribacter sp.]|jgi:tRNA-splicing ligase RtcB
MSKLKLRKKELQQLGYPDGPAIGMAINMMLKHYKRLPKNDVLILLKDIVENAENYKKDKNLNRIVTALYPEDPEQRIEIPLIENPKHYPIYGADGIEQGATDQMDIAMRLPVTVAGALMPDAHPGYGLPIGGVLAVENAVIPYGVGMDIGCRMCLSIYDRKPEVLINKTRDWKTILLENTRFGKREFDFPMDHEVLHSPLFKEIPFLKPLIGKARKQIGSSGSGNHFVEFGEVNITDINNEFALPLGTYLGVLSHSGSRGFGAHIAKEYTNIAMNKCLLPNEAKHLAWLSLDTEEGQEYWLAMNLAGDYAAACHDHIHQRISKAMGDQPIAVIENHHNFAWKEKMENGKEAIVHRKGATPAGKGVLGIIPGSMTAPGYIVRGTGAVHSINSASHGAGRKMSRTKAQKSTTHNALKKHLKEKGVSLIGGGLDEAPFAYKDIEAVMDRQKKLVDIIGTFLPKIVRMAR